MPETKPSETQIQQRAYELFLERGCEHGRDVEDWLEAERELAEFAADAEPLPELEEPIRLKTKAAVARR